MKKIKIQYQYIQYKAEVLNQWGRVAWGIDWGIEGYS